MQIAWHESLKLGQLTLGKMIKIVAMQCHQMSDFKAKMYQIQFRLRLRPRPRWGAYSAPPDFLAGLRGPTSKERGEGRGGQGSYF